MEANQDVAFATGETVPEQLQLAHDLEAKAVAELRSSIALAERVDDQGTATMLREMLVDEEGQLDWIQTQLDLVERIGEKHYLAQQVRE